MMGQPVSLMIYLVLPHYISQRSIIQLLHEKALLLPNLKVIMSFDDCLNIESFHALAEY